MRFYLDHAATAPLRPEARDAWLAASSLLGNASSTHGAGQGARRLLEESRERAAAVLGCDPIEVVFTSGGTESINTALHGLWASRVPGTSAIVLPDGEHHATMDTVAALTGETVHPTAAGTAGAGSAVAEDDSGGPAERTAGAGLGEPAGLGAASGGTGGSATVRRVPLDETGRVSVASFAAALHDGSTPRVALATALAANNEVGTINDSAALAMAAATAEVPF
ncbi:MAG: aminotransferase class V-fold PLP-dependent enzyme, partial [Microbacterium sp.]